MNKEIILLKKISQLPFDIQNKINLFIPDIIMGFLCKTKYLELHSIVKKYILRENFEKYIRDVIRNDNYFVFELLIKENFKKWVLIKKYEYKTTIYVNYLFFLLDYCIINNSDNCKNIINLFFKNIGLSKNSHKKNTYKNIRWTN
jgi:hypothetical protein